jgi:predicted HicB family RNase H-like nuclease
VGIYDEIYDRIKVAAKEKNVSMTQLVGDALEKYLADL